MDIWLFIARFCFGVAAIGSIVYVGLLLLENNKHQREVKEGGKDE